MKLTNSSISKTVFVIVLFASLCTGVGSSPGARVAAQDQSLYHRVGGYDALALVVDDFIGRLISDKQFERFFAGFSVDSKKRIRQHILDQFCAVTGGPCVYMGRDMKTTHAGLGITEKDWEAAVKHLSDALDKYKVQKIEKAQLLDLVSTLKKDIVEK